MPDDYSDTPADTKPNPTPPIICPCCHEGALKDRPCGCREFRCGAVLTCDDFHHGAGTLLDCPEDSSSSHRTGDSGEGVANATGSDAVVPSPPSLSDTTTTPTPEPLGLFAKYEVRKRATGEVVTDDCMVLKLKDRHARAAILRYADSVEFENPEFSNDLREWVADHV